MSHRTSPIPPTHTARSAAAPRRAGRARWLGVACAGFLAAGTLAAGAPATAMALSPTGVRLAPTARVLTNCQQSRAAVRHDDKSGDTEASDEHDKGGGDPRGDAASSSSSSSSSDKEKDKASDRGRHWVSIHEAISTAEHCTGGTAVAAEYNYTRVRGHGKAKLHVWEVDVRVKRTVWEVAVDAHTGCLLAKTKER